MATRCRIASTPVDGGPQRRRHRDVGDPRLDAVAPGGRQAVADDGPGVRGADHRHDAMAGAEQGRDGPAADEAVRARDQDGGHARGIVASTDDDPPPTPGRGDAQGRAPPAPRRVAPRRDGPRPRPDPGRRRAARLERDVARAHRADALRRPGRSSSRRSTCRSRSCRTPRRWSGSPRELVETKAAENVRYMEIRWGPLLHVAGGVPLADGIAAVCAGAAAGAARTGSVVRLICTALRSHDPAANLVLAETAVRFRDQGLTGWDLAGPEAAYPDPGPARRGVRCRARGRPADHAPCRGVGRRGAGAPRARDGPRAHRPRSRHHRRPRALRRADRTRRDAGPVPHLERAGRDRPGPGRPPARAPAPRGRAGDASRRTTRPSPTSPSPRSTPTRSRPSG